MSKINIPAMDSLPWDEIDNMIQADRHQEVIKKISKSTLRYLSSEKSRPELIESALNYLQKNNPEQATPSRAVNAVDIIQNFAKLALESKT
ncbi:hypothetical protein A3C59_04305 [Candidatus Daviesbacteria bacterium RIFCSPHIGHO2_02_FULL_36_13]|uniref:Uncharacterized protein n=1 Tax=Candidatus Daviesbacteria bacterium RIFCSPHIGHO2_02_FULL_36_13 TaxID=1797768 RepID=A0A1F5JW50_9BACT|nr:MAG: hypothetical protein A3C59_04305 [Candidatus Daviesbacteria bacterium RIFCSPHIGHO2_02_FULL_36_13]OGE42712.1 MAG: hypothetical protein A3A45_03205 [Candidatus Daviesbacteria bacterium RIFCSPLOWO2_01_FULL_36_8]